MTMRVLVVIALLGSIFAGRPAAQLQVPPPAAAPAAAPAPALSEITAAPQSELRDVVERYAQDRGALLRRYPNDDTPARYARLRAFYAGWQQALEALPVDGLGVEGRIDYVALRSRLEYEARLVAREEKTLADAAPLLPFAAAIDQLLADRGNFATMVGARAAAALTQIAADADRATKALGDRKPPRIQAYRAAEITASLADSLERWHRFYAGYDPLYTWFASDPYKKANGALRGYAKELREKIVGYKEGEDEPIVGNPVGREALVADLASEFIPYTPEDLLKVADRELAWCEAEMKKAAREMGFGDDWKAALEKVKTLYVPPGQQTDLVRDLAREAEAYVTAHDLVTVPPLAREVWRMDMMSPERQKVNPFFLGGEVIRVSYPTDGMSNDDKLMSMRGNNIHFSRATVFHELVPGHHLQQFMTARFQPQRRAFATPFWTEGWSLYWEMLLWDRGFARSPEDRVGMLFWRMHRSARIIFSLKFHMGQMTPQECIDLLVDKVGHERANAEGEVRRSFNGTYPPLYQLAYMMGGLQFRAMHKELVESGTMTDRAFHDAVLQGGNMPVELVRARLTGRKLEKDYRAAWRFLE